MATDTCENSANSAVPDKGSTLRDRLVRGMKWELGAQAGVQIWRFASNLVMTRLLAPEAFGVMGIVQAVMLGLELFSDIGLRGSVIHHRRSSSPEFLNTVWTVQVMRGIGLWVIVCLFAYPCARFYEMQELVWLMPLTGFSAIVRGFASTRAMTASRDLDIRFCALIDLGSQVCGSLVALLLAFITRSVEALAWGWIAGQACFTLLSHWGPNDHRHRLQLERSSVTAIASFGFWQMLSGIITIVIQRGDRLVLGRLMTQTQMGAYVIGANLAAVPLMFYFKAQHGVMHPVYARLRDDPPEKMRAKLRRARLSILLGESLLLVPLVVFGQPIVDFLYPQQLSAAGWYCSLVALAALVLISLDVGPIFPARGDSRTQFQITFARAVATLVGMYLGYQFVLPSGDGVSGLLIGLAFGPVLSYPFVAWHCSRIHAWLPDVDLIGLILTFSLAVGIGSGRLW